MRQDDKPLERHLRVGKATIGLIGLDRALSRVLAAPALSRDQAVTELFDAVRAENYIPAGKEAIYIDALAAEYDRLKAGGGRDGGPLTIRILGPGCVSCNNIQAMVIEIMAELGVAADIFQVHDLDEIGRFGVLQTPALLINGEVKSAGSIPTRSRIEQWLREAAGKQAASG